MVVVEMVAEAVTDNRLRTSGTLDPGDPEVCLSLEGQEALEDRDRPEETPGLRLPEVAREQSPAKRCVASGRVLCSRLPLTGRVTGSGG